MLQENASSSFVSEHPLVLLMNLLQLMSVPMMFLTEKNSAMPYSKFAASYKEEEKTKMVPSREGMLIIYAPACVVAFFYILLASTGVTSNFQLNIAAWMLLTHFAKRTLEVLFLHKYSGSTVLNIAKQIGFIYACQTLLICCTANSFIDHTAAVFGNSLFAVGISCNFYHHYLLARLRSQTSSKEKEKKRYTAPSGGLFEYVAAPHYLFELIEWLGIALSSNQITAYLVFAGMCAYLGARSSNQNTWNKEKFMEKDWPKCRKNLIPFVY